MAPIADVMRIVVRPVSAGDDFGQSYRAERYVSRHAQPVIVGSRAEAYELLGLDACPDFQRVT